MMEARQILALGTTEKNGQERKTGRGCESIRHDAIEPIIDSCAHR
jgi:hypothetical protein